MWNKLIVSGASAELSDLSLDNYISASSGYFSEDFLLSASGSTTGSPSIMGFTEFDSNGETARFQFGDAYNALETSYGDSLVLHSYNTLILAGGRELLSEVDFGSVAYNDNSEISTQFLITHVSKSVDIKHSSSNHQGQLLTFRDNNGFILASVSPSGGFITSQSISEITTAGTRSLVTMEYSDANYVASSSFAAFSSSYIVDSASFSASIGSMGGGGGTTVTALSFTASSSTLTLHVSGGSDLTVDLSLYTVLKVGDLIVDKDAGNSNYTTIEDNDKAFGWSGSNFIAYQQISGSPKYAINNQISPI